MFDDDLNAEDNPLEYMAQMENQLVEEHKRVMRRLNNDKENNADYVSPDNRTNL